MGYRWALARGGNRKYRKSTKRVEGVKLKENHFG